MLSGFIDAAMMIRPTRYIRYDACCYAAFATPDDVYFYDAICFLHYVCCHACCFLSALFVFIITRYFASAMPLLIERHLC